MIQRLLTCTLAVLSLPLFGACNCGGTRLRPSELAFHLEPAALDFGPVEEGASSTRTVRLVNEGTATLNAHKVIVSGSDAFECTLPAQTEVPVGGGLDLDVVFTATGGSGTIATGRLHVEVAETEEPEVSELTGETSERDAGVVARLLAFDSNREGGNRDLYLIRADGTGLKRLTTDPANDEYPAFSPDGKEIAFASDRSDFTSQLFILNLETLAVRQVTYAAEASRMPAWSPDGTRLAFQRRYSIYTCSADGTDEKLLVEPNVLPGFENVNAWSFPTWVSGGAWILADRNNQIDLIRPDGSEVRHVVTNAPTISTMASAAPAGSQFAFMTNCGQGPIIRASSLGRESASCSGETSEVFFPGRRPVWGPEHIAFEDTEANADIHLITPPTGTPVNLTRHAADDRNPAWAPR